MRIIFSRKGFDSSAGGFPSPILPDGRIVSLPIPEPLQRPGVGRRYSTLRLDTKRTYLDLMRELGIEHLKRRGTRLPLTEEAEAHLDPDLVPDVVDRWDGWRPIFGQAGTAQAELLKAGIREGDLFLFFGWFRRTCWTERGLDWERPLRVAGLQAVFAYFQIDKIVPVGPDTDIPWAQDHPHFRGRDRPQNTVYLPRNRLSLAEDLPGCGTLSYTDALRLTLPGRPPSVWLLPACFHPSRTGDPLTKHRKEWRWTSDGDNVILQTVGRGQEFVVNANEEITAWVKDLIREARSGPRTRDS